MRKKRKKELARKLFAACLGQLICRRRKALKMAQWELAERAGMHRTYISDLENGSRNLSLSNLYELAEALGTDGSKLLASVERQLKKNG